MSTATSTGQPWNCLQEIMAVAKRLNIRQDIMLHKFLQALPPSMAPVIASQRDLTPAHRGQLADDNTLIIIPCIHDTDYNATAK